MDLDLVQVCCENGKSMMDWHWIGNELTSRKWRLAAHWPLIGAGLAPDWHHIGTGYTPNWQLIGA